MHFTKLKKIGKRIGAVIAIGTLTTGLISAIGVNTIDAEAAEVWPNSIDTVSNGAIVMELETGAILYDKNMDTQFYPASITKILTALLALENSGLDEVVTFSSDAVFKNEGDTSHIGRDLNEQMTMEQCLYGMMLESANECAYAIAEHVGGGDVNKFVNMMNEKAKELGCTNTHFVTPNGLHDPQHYTTAHDMALIAREAYKNKEFAKIAGTRSYTIPPTNKHAEPTLLNNHHAMLNYYQTNKYLYEPCLGGKTGYTTDAGATLVTYAKKDGMTLVCVVLKGETTTYYQDTINLLNYCFDNFAVYSMTNNSDVYLHSVEGKLGSLNKDSKYIKLADNGTVVLPKTADFADAKSKVVASDTKDENVVGQIQYYYADRFVGLADILYEKASEVPYPFHNIDEEQGGSDITYVRFDFKMVLIILVIAAAVAAIVYFFRRKSGKILLFKKRRFDSRKKEKPKYTVIKRRDSRRRRRRKRW